MSEVFGDKILRLFSALLALLLAFYYLPYLTGSSCFFFGDAAATFEPICQFFRQSIKDGQSPFWNPYVGCGASQIAYPVFALFYPLNLLFLFFPFSQSLALTMIFHQVAAATGTYLLVREFGWRRESAVLGGLIFGLNGYMFSLAINFTLVAGAAWLPFCFWSLLKLVRGDRAYFPAFAAFAGLIIAAGRPEIFLPGLAICGLIAVAYFFPQISRTDLRAKNAGAGFAFLSMLVGVLLAAPVILPTWEWLSLSTKGSGLSLDEQLLWSASWYDFLCLFLFQPLGDPFKIGNVFVPLMRPASGLLPFFVSAYVGPAAFVLALIAFLDKKWTRRLLLFLLLTIIALLAAGKNSPLMPALMTLFPALKVLRYPVKLFCFLDLIIALAAARGLETELSSTKSSSFLRVVAAFCLLVIVAALCISCLPQLHSSVAGCLALYLKADDAQAALKVLADSAATASLLGLLCLASLMLKNRSTALVSSLLYLQLLLSFFCWAQTFKYEAPADFYERPSFLADRLNEIASREKVETAFLPFNLTPVQLPLVYKQAPEDGALKIALYERQLLESNTFLHYGIRSLFPFGLAETADLSIVRDLSWSSCGLYDLCKKPDDLPLQRLCQMTGTQFVETQIECGSRVHLLDSRLFRLRVEEPGLNIRIYQTVDCPPHAYLIKNWTFRDDRMGIIREIANPSLSGFNPLRSALVHKTLSTKESELIFPDKKADSKSPISSSSDLQTLLRRNDEIKFSARCGQNTLLIVNDSFYPGWKAWVDGNPVRIFRVNAACRGVFLGPGTHVVEFKYLPESLLAGLFLFAAGFLSCIIFLFKDRSLAWILSKKNDAESIQ